MLNHQHSVFFLFFFCWVWFCAALDFKCLFSVFPVPTDSVHCVYICSIPVFPVVMSDRSAFPLSIFFISLLSQSVSVFILSSHPGLLTSISPFVIWCWFHSLGFWFLYWNRILCNTCLTTSSGTGPVHCCCDCCCLVAVKELSTSS